MAQCVKLYIHLLITSNFPHFWQIHINSMVIYLDHYHINKDSWKSELYSIPGNICWQYPFALLVLFGQYGYSNTWDVHTSTLLWFNLLMPDVAIILNVQFSSAIYWLFSSLFTLKLFWSERNMTSQYLFKECHGKVRQQLSSYRDPQIEDKNSCDCLIFKMEIWKDGLYTETSSQGKKELKVVLHKNLLLKTKEEQRGLQSVIEYQPTKLKILWETHLRTRLLESSCHGDRCEWKLSRDSYWRYIHVTEEVCDSKISWEPLE